MNSPVLMAQFLQSNTVTDLLVHGRIEEWNSKATVQQNPVLLDRRSVRCGHAAAVTTFAHGSRAKVEHKLAAIGTRWRIFNPSRIGLSTVGFDLRLRRLAFVALTGTLPLGVYYLWFDSRNDLLG